MADDCLGICACLCCCCSLFGSCNQPGNLCNMFSKINITRRKQNAEDEAFAAEIEREMQRGGSLSMRSDVPPPTKPMVMHSRQQSKPHEQGLAPPEYEHRRQGSASSLVEKESPRNAPSVPIASSDAPGLDGQGYPPAVGDKTTSL